MIGKELSITKRYDLLDTYKFFASIGVIAIHCRYQLDSHEWYKNIQFLMTMCVPYFFMVSGYFLDENEHKINKQLKKICNLYLYTFVLYSIINLSKSDTYTFPSITIQTLIEVLFLNKTPWNGILWYLPAILMLLLLDKYIFSKKSYITNNIILPTSLAITLLTISCLHKGIINFTVTNVYIQGIPFYLIGKNLKKTKEKKLVNLTWIGIILSTLISFLLLGIKQFYEFRFLIGTCIIIPIFISGILNNKDNIIIHFLGTCGRKLSTGIYIYHVIALWITPSILKRCNHENLFFSFPVLTVLFTTIGIILMEFTTKWIISYLKMKYATHLYS